MDEETKQAFEKVDERLTSLNTSINNFGGNILRLTADMARMSGDITGLKGDITGLKGDITVIKDNTLQNCKKLDTLEKKIDQLISK